MRRAVSAMCRLFYYYYVYNYNQIKVETVANDRHRIGSVKVVETNRLISQSQRNGLSFNNQSLLCTSDTSIL